MSKYQELVRILQVVGYSPARSPYKIEQCMRTPRVSPLGKTDETKMFLSDYQFSIVEDLIRPVGATVPHSGWDERRDEKYSRQFSKPFTPGCIAGQTCASNSQLWLSKQHALRDAYRQVPARYS